MSPFVRNLLILAAVAAAVVVLNQQTALASIGALLRIAFLIALAVVAYFYWRDFARAEIGLWPTLQQWVIYGAVALLVVDLGWYFFSSPNGRDALVFFVVAAVCVYAGISTWRRQKSLS